MWYIYDDTTFYCVFFFTKNKSFVTISQIFYKYLKDVFMNLKRLEISGFKSFRDRVILDFSSGTTGIVGPNGCGKSNIVDAIRWVMGEQRVKALRGKKMDDVVFNGSQDSAPVSMAEITMTLIANGNSFPGAYSDLNEISISRKVVLDGESEYYINKAPCRLLDIKEFFMGTGVGAPKPQNPKTPKPHKHNRSNYIQ